MTLKELYETKYANVAFIGLYETDKNGKVVPIYPEYADEMLETHGDKIVDEHFYSAEKDVLVVILKED